jgi:hypothetical protein
MTITRTILVLTVLLVSGIALFIFSNFNFDFIIHNIAIEDNIEYYEKGRIQGQFDILERLDQYRNEGFLGIPEPDYPDDDSWKGLFPEEYNKEKGLPL